MPVLTLNKKADVKIEIGLGFAKKNPALGSECDLILSFLTNTIEMPLSNFLNSDGAAHWTNSRRLWLHWATARYECV